MQGILPTVTERMMRKLMREESRIVVFVRLRTTDLPRYDAAETAWRFERRRKKNVR
jgi:hypothetical protein